MRAWVVPVDADKPVREVEVHPDRMHWAKSEIAATWLEFVRTPDEQVYMVVDEEGHLAGKSINARASRLYPGATGIVGDVLLVGWDAMRGLQGSLEMVDAPWKSTIQVERWLDFMADRLRQIMMERRVF